MTDRVMARPRRRTEISLSSPEVDSDPVEQLDRAVELLHRVTRGLSARALSPEELIALGGLLTQVSGALLTFTEMLIPPVHHYDRIRALTSNADSATPQTATAQLRDCRNSYHAAGLAARSFHADLKQVGTGPATRANVVSPSSRPS